MSKLSFYGFCPFCGAPGASRERRPNGNDVCVNLHVYPSCKAIKSSKSVPTEEVLTAQINSLQKQLDEVKKKKASKDVDLSRLDWRENNDEWALVGIPLDSNDMAIIDQRELGEFAGRSFLLNKNFIWKIMEDVEGELCLIPTKKSVVRNPCGEVSSNGRDVSDVTF